ncbi:MAG: 4-hydroxy-3-methylbut-2-enyl diphosphate reductase, partial [Christensenellales bacterium]
MNEKIIYVSKTNGFCKGVGNAVATARKYAGENVYTLGEIVHNKRVVNELAKLGIKMVEDVSALKKGDTLIIRSHGATKAVFEQCEKQGVRVVDATCPYVKVIRNKAEEYFRKGYVIVLVGDRNHPELQGINGWCGDSAVFFDGKGKLELETDKNVLVLFQTTYESKKVDETLQNIVADNAKTVEFFNTICYTTEDRQNYALCVSRKSECCVVVGGRNSSNTKKLFDIARANCKDSFLIEEAAELSDICLSKYSRMSLIAGASTPQELMEEVLSKMFAEAKDNSATVAVEEISKENEANEFASAVEKIGKRRPLRKGQKIKGTVSHISEEGVNVSIGTKTDGFIPNEEMTLDGDVEAAKKNLSVGDSIEVIVTSTDKGLTLSRKEVEELYKDDELVEGIKEGKEFDLTMNKAVKGGLLSKLGSYTVFVPA